MKTTTKIEIQSDIPIPENVVGSSKYPFDTLEVGQSFFIPLGNLNSRSLCTFAGAANARYETKRFVSRKATESGVVGRRFWRIQ